MDSDGQERDALYEQAERLSNSLVTMGQQLRETVEVCLALCCAAIASNANIIFPLSIPEVAQGMDIRLAAWWNIFLQTFDLSKYNPDHQ